MKRTAKRILVAGVVALALAAGGYAVYRTVTWVPMDFSPLTRFAETQQYETLIKHIQATPAGPGGFTFVALGDTRSNIDIARDVMSQVVEEKPAFIVSNGDLVRKGRVEEYVAHHIPLVEMAAPAPFIPAPGNHEKGPNNDFSAFRYIYGGERFSFDYGNSRFVGINNGDWNGLSSDDLRYLEEELGKPGVAHKFVLFHVPPRYMESAVESDGARGFTWNAGKLRALLTRMKVDEVFVGHVHGFASEIVDGVRYTITGGAGASLTTNLGKEGNVHNYVVVHVGPNGVKSEVVRFVNGEWVRSEIK